MIIVEKFEFLISGDELAIAVDFPVTNIKNICWDGKNTIVINSENDNKYVLMNILPNIRQMLENTKTLMLIFMQGQEIAEAYDIELTKDTSLEFDDLFYEEAISCYRKIEELKKS